MYFYSEKLHNAETLEKRIFSACNYNGAKAEFISGNIITIKSTNLSYIEPHKAIINIKDIKLILIYYDNNSLFLFDRTNPLKVSELKRLINDKRQELIYDK
ncbi:MAG: hypothetical protein HFJ11_05780 [Bacilli bacterium]|nr:hypothetical protein [Bacilli bacterium]